MIDNAYGEPAAGLSRTLEILVAAVSLYSWGYVGKVNAMMKEWKDEGNFLVALLISCSKVGWIMRLLWIELFVSLSLCTL